jgi:hypothetical protein
VVLAPTGEKLRQLRNSPAAALSFSVQRISVVQIVNGVRVGYEIAFQ